MVKKAPLLKAQLVSKPKVASAKKLKQRKRRPKPLRDPALPKKPISSFFLFSKKRRAEIRQDSEDKRLQKEIMAAIGEEWRKLDQDEKAVFEQEREKALKEYKCKMEEYEKSGAKARWEAQNPKPCKRRKKAPKKDPNKPKKSPSAYLLFSQSERSNAGDQKLPMKDIAAKWSALSQVNKSEFESKAQLLKAKYQEDMEAYNASDAKKKWDEKEKHESSDDDVPTGPKIVPKIASKKMKVKIPRDPKKPKVPPNAYVLFCRKVRYDVRENGEKIPTHGELAERWKSCGGERAEYEAKYSKLREEYVTKMAEYKSSGAEEQWIQKQAAIPVQEGSSVNQDELKSAFANYRILVESKYKDTVPEDELKYKILKGWKGLSEKKQLSYKRKKVSRERAWAESDKISFFEWVDDHAKNFRAVTEEKISAILNRTFAAWAAVQSGEREFMRTVAGGSPPLQHKKAKVKRRSLETPVPDESEGSNNMTMKKKMAKRKVLKTPRPAKKEISTCGTRRKQKRRKNGNLEVQYTLQFKNKSSDRRERTFKRRLHSTLESSSHDFNDNLHEKLQEVESEEKQQPVRQEEGGNKGEVQNGISAQKATPQPSMEEKEVEV
ncbi:hypothetical protein AAMO2058_000906200 [Amorphochlora amoebiformis]